MEREHGCAPIGGERSTGTGSTTGPATASVESRNSGESRLSPSAGRVTPAAAGTVSDTLANGSSVVLSVSVSTPAEGAHDTAPTAAP
jgi:hypothetical protein